MKAFEQSQFKRSDGCETLVYCPLCRQRAIYKHEEKDFNIFRFVQVFECVNDKCEMQIFILQRQKG